jgi:hypothetical protein
MVGSSSNLKSMLMFTIVNNENKKAILINLSDRLEPNLLPNHGFDNFNIVQIIYKVFIVSVIQSLWC